MTLNEAVAAFAEIPSAEALRSRYAEPWRRYHTERHLSELLDHLLAAEREGVPIHDGAAALAFVLWHDAVYDPRSAPGRNEELSAQLCESEFSRFGAPESVDRAVAAILATAGHRVPEGACSPDAALLLDVDLAILGAEEDRFDRYAADIRREYAHVDGEAYRKGRAEVLQGFLRRDRIFGTDWARRRWEDKARSNLARALAGLGRG